MEDATTAPRDARLDLMRVLAIAAVLVIHSATRYATADWEKVVGGCLSHAAKPCIGVFLFLAGFLFRPGRLWARFGRVLLPYLIFSLAAFAYLALVRHQRPSPPALLQGLLMGQSGLGYYFVFVVCLLYGLGYLTLRSAFLSRHLVALAGVLLAINLVHVTDVRFFAETLGFAKSLGLYQYRAPFTWAVFFFGGLAFRADGLQPRLQPYRRWIRWAWAVLGIVTVTLFALKTVRLIDVNVSGYWSPLGTAYTVSTILMLMTLDVTAHPKVAFLADKSYFIYLTHGLFVWALIDLGRQLCDRRCPFYVAPLSLAASILGPLVLWVLLHRLLHHRTRPLFGA